MAKKYKGSVDIKNSKITDKDGKTLETWSDAARADAECGCGIDCCKQVLRLKDSVTGLATELYIESGVVKTRLA